MTPHAQEPVRPFPVVLRPRPDELLSSWLTRHAAYYGVTRRRLLDHVGILSPSVEALDREITLGQQIMLAGYFRRQPFEIAAMSYETAAPTCARISEDDPRAASTELSGLRREGRAR